MALDRRICPIPEIDLSGDSDWKRAIREYDAKVAAGLIRFDTEGFAIMGPTADVGNFNEWLRDHLSLLDAPDRPEGRDTQ